MRPYSTPFGAVTELAGESLDRLGRDAGDRLGLLPAGSAFAMLDDSVGVLHAAGHAPEVDARRAHLVQQAQQEKRVGSRLNEQVLIRDPSGFAAPRVDHDDLPAALADAFEALLDPGPAMMLPFDASGFAPSNIMKSVRSTSGTGNRS